MSRRDLEKLEGGRFRRKIKRKIGIFIDGVGLDRATRRLNRKVDLTRFMASLTSGLSPEIARYYTLVPHEDDARQLAFLEAVERAGLEVCLKRLPPRHVNIPVNMDVHIGIDMVCFALGAPEGVSEHFFDDSITNAHLTNQGNGVNSPITPPQGVSNSENIAPAQLNNEPVSKSTQEVQREVVLVCPNRDLRYAVYRCHTAGARTSLADFKLYGSSDGWRGLDTWIDLSTSETIWRD